MYSVQDNRQPGAIFSVTRIGDDGLAERQPFDIHVYGTLLDTLVRLIVFDREWAGAMDGVLAHQVIALRLLGFTIDELNIGNGERQYRLRDYVVRVPSEPCCNDPNSEAGGGQ